MTILAVTLLLLLAVILWVTERVPVDLTALGVMTALLALGILSPQEALAGLANPAPVTVAALFVLSRGLVRTGALDAVTSLLVRHSHGSERRLLFLSLFLVGGFSSFMNNTPVVVLFTAVVVAASNRHGLSPSKFLLPISFVSILAGTSTLIGTSTNILVSDLAVQAGHAPLGVFELSWLGVPLAMAGAVFLFFAAPRLLPAHREPVFESQGGDGQRYISELLIPAGSPLKGGDALAGLRQRFPDIELFEVLREQQVLDPHLAPVELRAGDVLLVKATAPQLAQILDRRCALLPQGADGTAADPHDHKELIVELLVPPNSDAVGRRLVDLLANLDAHVRVIGVKRHWTHLQPEQVRHLRLAVGDLVLVQTPLDHLEQVRASAGLLVLEDVHQHIVNRRKAPLAIAIFAAMVVAAATGLAGIMTASLVATLAMLVTGCLSMREAYRALDGRVLLLIVGTLALGAAIAKTGAASLYASAFLHLVEGASPQVVLSAFILLTSVLSLFLSNSATAVLLLPVALATAHSLGLDARPFIVGVCFGASACYATPFGYQTNMLVYGPGGYRFSDYLKLGLPLNLAVWLGASVGIPLLWPL